jgi:hypothetical protein
MLLLVSKQVIVYLTAASCGELDPKEINFNIFKQYSISSMKKKSCILQPSKCDDEK